MVETHTEQHRMNIVLWTVCILLLFYGAAFTLLLFSGVLAFLFWPFASVINECRGRWAELTHERRRSA